MVTGIGIICAGGRNATEFWETLMGGKTAVAALERPEMAPAAPAVAGCVSDDWITAALPGPERKTLGRDEQLGVIAAREAVKHAELDPVGWDPTRVAMVLGMCQPVGGGAPRPLDWGHATAETLCRLLNIAGARQTISTACAASTNAIGAAADWVRFGTADVVLAGGVDILQLRTFLGFQSLRSLDDQPSSPYSRSEGLNLGEGAAFLIIEESQHAADRGVHALAHVLGYGLSADAYHATAPDPTGRGALLAVERALASSAIEPAAVDYVNGHGTGTSANDTTERRMMAALFGTRDPQVPIISTKSFVGHTLGAAGAVEAVASVLSLVQNVIPPTANVAEPAPIDIDCVPNAPRAALVRTVLSNSYAFGGNNASLVLGSSPSPPRQEPRQRAMVTGIGLLGSPGIGVDDWASSLTDGVPGDHGGEALWAALAKQPFAAPNVWRRMNSFTRLALAATRLALDDANFVPRRNERDEIGLFAASMAGALGPLMRTGDGSPPESNAGYGPREDSVHAFTQSTPNAFAGQVCQVLGLRGPATALASGIGGTQALETALQFIAQGRSRWMLVLAVEVVSHYRHELYQQMKVLSTDGRAHPYDPSRPGTGCAVAAAAVLVESESSAAEAGRRPYAELAAAAHTGDVTPSFTFDPCGSRYAAALELAAASAGGSAAGVDLIYGMANGTTADTCELAAVATAAPGAALRSVKGITGECDSASGLINVAAAALTLSGRIEPIGTAAASATRANDGQSVMPQSAFATSASFGDGYGAVLLRKVG